MPAAFRARKIDDGTAHAKLNLANIIPVKTEKIDYANAGKIISGILKRRKVPANEYLVSAICKNIYQEGMTKKNFCQNAEWACEKFEKLCKKMESKAFSDFIGRYDERIYDFARFLYAHTDFAMGLVIKETAPAFEKYGNNSLIRAYEALVDTKIVDFLETDAPTVHQMAQISIVKKTFMALLELESRIGPSAITGSICNEDFGKAFINDPLGCLESMVGIIEDTKSKTDKEGQGGIDRLRHAFYIDNFGKAYAADQKSAMKALREINKKLPNGENLFNNEQISKLLVMNPAKTVAAIIALQKKTGNDDISGWLRYGLGDEFAKSPQTAEKIILDFTAACGKNTYGPWMLVGSENGAPIIEAYKKNPQRILSAVSKINKLTWNDQYGCGSLGHVTKRETAALFASNPEFFTQIAADFGRDAYIFFDFLNYKKVAAQALKAPGSMIASFRAIAEIDRKKIASTISILSSQKGLHELFAKNQAETIQALRNIRLNADDKYQMICDGIRYAHNKDAISYFSRDMDVKKFLMEVRMTDNYCIELGRPLDDLHNEDLRNPRNKRTAYLAKLSKDDVVALLTSPPDFFYTSSNNLLFDRLQALFPGRKITDVLNEYHLAGTQKARNMMLRSISYGRFSGTPGALFTKGELKIVVPQLLAPLADKEYDNTYYYLLANSLKQIKDAGLSGNIIREMRKQLSEIQDNDEESAHRKRAMEFLLYALPKVAELERNSIYDASKYKGIDGKLRVVQVFDKEDVGKDHWGLSKAWFAKYGAPKIGASGEHIYETPNAKIMLYMGKDEYENQKFIKKMLADDPHMVITFRGHSFSLEANMPKDIFGNNPNASVLFIPGSCGSVGSIPRYLAGNFKSDIRVVGNISTGMGQVTNSLIDIFIEEAARGKKRPFVEIIQGDGENRKKIEANGGTPEAIKSTSVGELLIAHVYGD